MNYLDIILNSQIDINEKKPFRMNDLYDGEDKELENVGCESYVFNDDMDDRYITMTLESLSAMIDPSGYTIGLEDDNPFGDFGDSDDGGFDFGGDESFGSDNSGSGDDGGNPFEDTGGSDDDSFGGSDDNPFGGDDSGGSDDFGGGFDFDSAEDDSDSFFGDDGGSDKKKDKSGGAEFKLDRSKTNKEEFSMDNKVRLHFPKKFKEIKEIINGNIEKINKIPTDNQTTYELLSSIIKEYQETYTLIDAYIDEITEKTYDDIFSTYMGFYAQLNKLKMVFDKTMKKIDAKQ